MKNYVWRLIEFKINNESNGYMEVTNESYSIDELFLRYKFNGLKKEWEDCLCDTKKLYKHSPNGLVMLERWEIKGVPYVGVEHCLVKRVSKEDFYYEED